MWNLFFVASEFSFKAASNVAWIEPVLEEFDNDSKVKEKGRTSVNFQDKTLNFSWNSEQSYQVHQN